jgi:hypothetical protein
MAYFLLRVWVLQPDYWKPLSLAALSGGLCLGAAAESATADLPDDSATRLEPVTITRTNWAATELKEDQPIGPNEQPEWTTRRRFATTRVYVLPPWQVEFEEWWKGQWPREGQPNQLFQSEIGIGLPYRFQLDLYHNTEQTSEHGIRQQGFQVEGRWALADWGKIPLNPTLYGEWVFNNFEPDKYEVKLLLGQDLAPRVHYGLNFFYEQEVGGSRGSEMGAAQAVSYTLIDEKLGAGVEMKLEHRSQPSLSGTPELEFDLGPSIQWRPTPRIHLDLVPLFGVTHNSPLVEAWVVFGFDLGPSGNHERIYARLPQ